MAIGLSIQQFNIAPQIEEGRKRLDDAQEFLKPFPDIEKVFDGLIFAESETEATRRFKKWEAYIESIKAKASHFFVKPVD